MKTNNTNTNTEVNTNPEYYVYIHKTLNGTPFYVGSGKTSRATNKYNRSVAWNNVAKDGFEVEIIEEELDRDFALLIESYYINEYGRKDLGQGTLVNHSDGGLGSGKNKVLTEQHKQALKVPKTKYEVMDTNTGIYYDSIIDASNTLGYVYTTLLKKLKGERYNNTNLIAYVV